jgi:uncharacterized protein YeaO (DUF488 family)
VRLLVDRLCLRVIREENAALASKMKEVAPSDELRTWFDHRAERFAEFARRYPATDVFHALAHAEQFDTLTPFPHS